MSGGIACKCSERAVPLADRRWRVVDRQCNYSAFSGSRWTPSAYSLLTCLACGAYWRTKAPFVSSLKDHIREGAKP